MAIVCTTAYQRSGYIKYTVGEFYQDFYLFHSLFYYSESAVQCRKVCAIPTVASTKQLVCQLAT